MKKTLLLIFLFISSVGGGYYYFEIYQNNKIGNLWSMVPENAVYVYELNNPVSIWNYIQQQDAWSNLSPLPFYKDLKSNFELLDSLGGNDGSLDKFFRNNLFLVSAHVISNEAFDHIFYTQIKTTEERQLSTKLLKVFQDQKELTHDKRIFNGVYIHEIINKKEGKSFSYILEGDFFAGSFTPYLIEDVVRNLSQGEGFVSKSAELFDITKLENDEGNLYVNISGLAQLGMVFSDQKDDERLKRLSHFAKLSFLDLKIKDDEFLLSGFFLPGKRRDYLQIFQNQSPGKMDMRFYIPARTAFLYHLTFHDPKKWGDSLWIYRLEYEKNFRERWQTAGVELSDGPAPVYEKMSGELGLSVLESSDISNPDQVLFIKMKDIRGALTFFNNLSEQVQKNFSDSVYIEKYGNTEIRQLKIKEFPELLFGNMFSGFENCFYFSVGDYLAIGNKISSVKDVLFEIDAENTWGRSVLHNQFLEGLIQEANISLVVNTQRYWNNLTHRVSPKWKAFMNENFSTLRSYELAAVQIVSMDDKFYTNIDIKYNKDQVFNNKFPELNIDIEISNSDAIVSRPSLIRNQLKGGYDILFQDKEHVIKMISSDGSLLWDLMVDGPIMGKVQQIDYYNNKEKQFLFSTENKLHLVNARGQYIPTFPIDVPEKTGFHHLSVVDYDNNKNYRFFTSSRDGNLYLFDKYGRMLEGWNPKKLDFHLSQPPFHFRGGNKDCMIAIQENGVINVLSRRGENLAGFPLDLQSKIVSPVFVEQGSSLATTYLTIVNQEGEIVVINLEGRVQKREQLYRPSKETFFKLVPDALGRTFVIARQERNRLSVLNRRGVSLFERDFVASDLLSLQYYDFGAGNEIFVVNDLQQEFTYIFNPSGDLINSRPFESSFDIALLFSDFQNKFTVYKAFGNKIQVLSFHP